MWGRSEEGWTWLPEPSVVLGSSYPSRVVTDDHDPEFKPRPVGFTAALTEAGTPKPVTESHTTTRRCDDCGDVLPYHHRCCTRTPTTTENPHG